MSRIVIATSPGSAPHAEDTELAHELSSCGYQVAIEDWRAPEPAWRDVDVVVVRSCWDYHLDLDAFTSWALAVERHALVINPVALLRWNADKRYLLKLEARGVRIVPTHVMDQRGSLPAVLEDRGWEHAVVKPVVSANADSTWRTERARASADERRIQSMWEQGKQPMVQPFMAELVRAGEWSLVFFDGAFSHAIRRKPALGDFRVQACFGGVARVAEAPSFLVRQARAILSELPEEPVYARVDGLMRGTELILTEVEVIEPMLFFEADRAAAQRLARAIHRRTCARLS